MASDAVTNPHLLLNKADLLSFEQALNELNRGYQALNAALPSLSQAELDVALGKLDRQIHQTRQQWRAMLQLHPAK